LIFEFDNMTPFAKKVYQVVAKIPLGEVRTYKWVAKKAGYPKAYRAAGQVLKKNPYPLIIPCHRVVASSAGVGGYVWGKKKKAALLNLERQIKKLML
jgi:O-6-methylguanine DNA methyltransferase